MHSSLSEMYINFIMTINTYHCIIAIIVVYSGTSKQGNDGDNKLTCPL